MFISVILTRINSEDRQNILIIQAEITTNAMIRIFHVATLLSLIGPGRLIYERFTYEVDAMHGNAVMRFPSS